MRKNFSNGLLVIVLSAGITMSILIGIVLFIPMIVYGLLNGLNLKEIFECYWINGFYETVSSELKELRGLL